MDTAATQPGTEAIFPARDISGANFSPGDPEDFLSGGGLMGLMIREFDWSATPLGPIETWSPSLRTSISICLNSQFPIILWWGPELTILYNDAYAPILGVKHPGDALGKPCEECWHEVWGVIGPMLTGVMKTGDATFSEDLLLMLERAGYPEECYFTFSYSPIRDETGGVGGVFCPVKEVTEKVLNERRLRTLRELADRGTKAWDVDEACRITMEALARNPYDISFACLYLSDDHAEQVRLAGAAGIEPGTAASPELIHLNGDVQDLYYPALIDRRTLCFSRAVFGSLPEGPWDIPPESIIVLPLSFAGQPQQCGALVAGVNARKRVDDEYHRFLELVACQIGDTISAALAYEQARKRADSLAELDSAKTAFFSNISHEFRTPLTLMLGPLEDTLAGELKQQTRDNLKTVHRNGLRLLKLVNTLLDFARIEAGRVQAFFEPTDLAQYTADLTSVFRSAVEKAGMYLEVDCPSLSEPVYVNRDMWEKIVLNLLSNAFKFTLQGGIRVAMTEDANAVYLAIEDTGIGIAEEEQPHLFERFHRVADGRGRSFEGSGIGLALVRELVQQHGGAVSVRSIPDHGSSFIVSLPRGAAHLPPERTGADRRQASTAMRTERLCRGSAELAARCPVSETRISVEG